MLAFLLVLGTLRAASAQETVSPDYFGMHIHNAATGTVWPEVPFRCWRLWDASVAWPDLEPNRGEWHFSRLDDYVTLAQQHHVQILLTLGLTPQWASARPEEKSDYKPGNAAEPKDLATWRDYIRVVATRYRGRIREYEIWNEPNRKDDFSGDAGTLAEMTREAALILKQIDPSIKVVSASPTATNGLPWFSEYLALGAGRYVDVVGYHLYVNPDPPETMLPLNQAVRQIMALHGIGDKPLWDTETGWAQPKHFASPEEAAAFVSRAYVLNWPGGVRRLYWYAWDNHAWVTLEMTDRLTQQPTVAAKAYATTRGWLTGARMRPCDVHNDGTWICELQRGEDRSWIVWNVRGASLFHMPAGWSVHAATDVLGKDMDVGRGTLQLGIAPVLLHH